MHQRHGLVNSLLLALVLAVGTAVVWGFVCGFCADAIRRWQRRQPSSLARTAEQLLVTSEGVPVIATIGNRDYHYRTYRTLDGEPVEAAAQIYPAALLDAETLEGYGWPVEWSARMTGVNDGQMPPQYWYLIHDGCRPGHAWLEGFDSVSKRRVGYLGRQGFSATPLAVADQFLLDGRLFGSGLVFGYFGPMEPRNFSSTSNFLPTSVSQGGLIPLWRGYLVTDGKLVEVDIRQRRVRTVLEEPGLLSAVIVEQAVVKDAEGRSTLRLRSLIAARSADRLWIIDPSANQMRQYALPGDWASRALEVYVLDDEVLLTNGAWFGRSSDVHLAWLDRDGRVVRERNVTLQQPYSRGAPGEWEAVGMLPIPTLLGLAAFVAYPLEQVWNGSAASYAEGLVAAWQRFTWPIIVVVLAAIALAVWCFRRHRRYAQPGVWMWCVFVLLLGVPGLIGYLLHRRWPVCETCSACGRRVAGDRDTCPACGAVFPAPPPVGTEIFAQG
jgi:hypothetical protein